MGRIFVSHATKNHSVVTEFCDLLFLGVGLEPVDVFCTSLPGHTIPTGEDFVDYIKSNVNVPKIVIALISEEFLKSAFCLNEVGAAWALSIPLYPFLVPPCDYSQ